MFFIHLRHTNICVLCYGRKPSASTCACFRAATREGLYIYSTRTVSQQTRLSVTFEINIMFPSSSLWNRIINLWHYTANIYPCQVVWLAYIKMKIQNSKSRSRNAKISTSCHCSVIISFMLYWAIASIETIKKKGAQLSGYFISLHIECMMN